MKRDQEALETLPQAMKYQAFSLAKFGQNPRLGAALNPLLSTTSPNSTPFTPAAPQRIALYALISK